MKALVCINKLTIILIMIDLRCLIFYYLNIYAVKILFFAELLHNNCILCQSFHSIRHKGLFTKYAMLGRSLMMCLTLVDMDKRG